jgi:hypothetical protein
MIEGLKFIFTSGELHRIMTDRYEHHANRLSWYQKQINELEKDSPPGESSHNTRIVSMRERMDFHGKKMAGFKIMKDHLSQMDYALTYHDLVSLEILNYN